jgi:pyruvate carboxylase
VVADYDPLIAKLMVVDESRDAAIDRLTRALDETTITGIQTTLPFHRFIATEARFRAADLSIDWVDDNWAAIAVDRRRAALDAAGEVAAAVVGGALVPDPSPPPPATVPSSGASARVEAAGEGAPARRSRAVPTEPGPSAWSRAGRAKAVDRWPR